MNWTGGKKNGALANKKSLLYCNVRNTRRNPTGSSKSIQEYTFDIGHRETDVPGLVYKTRERGAALVTSIVSEAIPGLYDDPCSWPGETACTETYSRKRKLLSIEDWGCLSDSITVTATETKVPSSCDSSIFVQSVQAPDLS